MLWKGCGRGLALELHCSDLCIGVNHDASHECTTIRIMDHLVGVGELEEDDNGQRLLKLLEAHLLVVAVATVVRTLLHASLSAKCDRLTIRAAVDCTRGKESIV